MIRPYASRSPKGLGPIIRSTKSVYKNTWISGIPFALSNSKMSDRVIRILFVLETDF